VVLAIETSCDETAIALLQGSELLASEVASQTALHAEYGGVVPEVASRNHLVQLRPLITRALDRAGIALEDIGLFAATVGPGLATSLMIGASFAKGLSLSTGRPFLAVNHLEGHLLSPFFGSSVEPCVALVVSGGHTLLVEIKGLGNYRLLGQTRDDAAGEAFDKVGKLLGLPYPGGPWIERNATGGDPRRFDLPRSMMDSGDFQFSFSGLKTAVRYLLPKIEHGADSLRDLCASFQEAVTDVLVAKTIRAAQECSLRLVTVSGGVSCNRHLRTRFARACSEHGLGLRLAAPDLCTDNAAMIAFVAAQRFAGGASSQLSADIDPNMRLVA
jgi:N6-L-threonylcarbamoyladenine synthase